MRVLICGDRLWANVELMARRIVKLPKDTIIIHGGAKGADFMSGVISDLAKLKVEVYPADWEKYGKAAGPIRNMQMLKEGKPDLVIAFHGDIDNSKGTKHMLKIAKEAGIPTELITE